MKHGNETNIMHHKLNDFEIAQSNLMIEIKYNKLAEQKSPIEHSIELTGNVDSNGIGVIRFTIEALQEIISLANSGEMKNVKFNIISNPFK